MTYTRLILFSLLLGGAFAAPPLSTLPRTFEKSRVLVEGHRVPQSVIPTKYDIELQPILEEGYGTRFTAPGKVLIDVNCLATTTSITLHALGLNILERSVKVTQVGGNEIGVDYFDVDAEKEFFTINLEGSVQEGNKYQIYIEFVAPIGTELLFGLFRSFHTADDGSTKYMAVTDLEATGARMVFPCFDEPHLKAEFTVSIIRLANYASLANTDLLRTEPNVPGLPGWVKDVYNPTELMSTYIFCIAVISDFTMEAAAPGLYTKPVQIWGPSPYMRAGAGKYSPDISAKLLTVMEQYFEIPYTFPKMDKIAVPHFLGGAMENWGLNTYRLNRLLLEDDIATSTDKTRTATTLSHELIHQWFGNLVTMKWWDDLWLNEGFASYYSNTAMAGIGLDDMLPMDVLVSDEVQPAMKYDVTNNTHPIHHSVVSSSDIPVLFDDITYSKGAALVRMIDAMLTEPVMKKAMVSYLTKFDHASAHQDDLFQVIQDEIDSLPESPLPEDLTVKEVLDSWTLQSGFPVLQVTRTENSPTVTIIQNQFKPDIDNELPDENKWHIPISLYSSTDPELTTSTTVWLKKDDPITFFTLPEDTQWFIVNPQQIGYFRVNYDTSSLSQIVEMLHTHCCLINVHSVFEPQTRSGLIDDSLNNAYAGYSNLHDALNLTMYLKNERHLTPWTTFLNNMRKPYTFLARSSGFAGFKKYVLGLMKDTLDEIKLEPQPEEPLGNGAILRSRLFEWACNLGDVDCIQYSRGKFEEFMSSGDLKVISPDLRQSVYCTAIANGGDQEWEFVLSQYKTANREITQTNLLRSLGCSKSSFRLSRLLDFAIDLNSNIPSSHRVIALQAVAGNSVGVELAFRFIRENFEVIRRRYGVSAISSVLVTLSNSWHREFDIADLERFVAENEEPLRSISGSVQTALGTVHENIKWMSKNGPQFKSFMEQI